MGTTKNLILYLILLIWFQHWSGQGGSGIRIPDRGPVGWLPLESRKKKKDFINFWPDRALLSTNVNYIFSIYYIELKSTEIRKKNSENCLHVQYMLPIWPLIGIHLIWVFTPVPYLPSNNEHHLVSHMCGTWRNWVSNACRSLRGGKGDEVMS